MKKFRADAPLQERIIGVDDYQQTAVLMPLFEKDGELHFLFEKRAKNIRQGGEVSFPGGGIEPKDKTPLDAAIREAVEELGIRKSKIEVLSKLGVLFNHRGFVVHVFVAEIKIQDEAELNFEESEVEKIFSLPVSFFEENEPDIYNLRMEIHPFAFDEEGRRIELFPAKELNLPSNYADTWKANSHKVLVYKNEKEVVWGLTAKMIYEFIKRAKELR